MPSRDSCRVSIFPKRETASSYAGVRFEFAIYPQEPGSFAISDQKVKIKYAAEPPAVREQVLALPRVSFAAFIPDAAAALNPYLAAQHLTIEQSIQRSSEQLKVGDSVTRIVTVRAEETPSMLLPPITLAAVDGLAVYPAQPSLEDKTEGRTDALTARRTDSATYILQRAGGYTLPAIDVRWWNAKEGRVETAHLDAVPMQVAVNPAAEAAAATPERAPGLDGGCRSRPRSLDRGDPDPGRAGRALLDRAARRTRGCRSPPGAPRILSAVRTLFVRPVAATRSALAMRRRPISRCSTGCNVSGRPPRWIP